MDGYLLKIEAGYIRTHELSLLYILSPPLAGTFMKLEVLNQEGFLIMKVKSGKIGNNQKKNITAAKLTLLFYLR